jgi:hypothetical protein
MLRLGDRDREMGLFLSLEASFLREREEEGEIEFDSGGDDHLPVSDICHGRRLRRPQARLPPSGETD